MHPYIEYSTEVQNALINKSPILALESTLISHGLPYPDNLNIALQVEEITRKEGVTPATIAILKGKIKIGLSYDELKYLATSHEINKVSVRDIPLMISQSLHGATTVAATIFLAQFAGIRVMATGGIGGVHRGNDLDVSADLSELARTEIAVVCAGAKSILDIPKTLEFLETCSVPIVGFKTNVFPAFYTMKTPYPVTAEMNSIDELARFMQVHFELQLSSGIVVAQPIPKENEISADIIESAIQQALARANAENITGKALTPFLLKELNTITLGKSVEANIALIKNNVLLGAKLAMNLQQISSLSQTSLDYEESTIN